MAGAICQPWGRRVTKTTLKLADLESLVRMTLRSGGIFAAQVAIAPKGTKGPGANWALLHVDGNRCLEPMTEELIRPLQTRYDLDW